MSHKQLNLKDRQNIQAHLEDRLSYEEIARRVKRSISTISDEIRRGKTKGVYIAEQAHAKVIVRKRNARFQGMKITHNKELREYVETHMKMDWSPELIVGRINAHETDLPHIGVDAVYKFVRSVHGRQLEKHLWYKNKRWKHNRSRVKKENLKNRTSIEKRPQYIEKRVQIGHFEGDFIVSGKHSTWVLLVLIERHSRYVLIRRLPNRINDCVNQAIVDLRKQVKDFRSLTLDNDIAFTKHETLALGLNCPVYFCHPFHSWEKGSVENVNRSIRRYIPKGKDMSNYTDLFVQEIQNKLNDRPRKLHNFATPREIMENMRQIKSPSV